MPKRYRKFQGEQFLLAEECENEFDAHDAAHVYRAHENLRCRVVPSEGSFSVYVGGTRTLRDKCYLRWCPHTPGHPASGKFFEPSPVLKKRRR